MQRGTVYSRLCSMCLATRDCENDISGVLALICLCQQRLSQNLCFFSLFYISALAKTPALKRFPEIAIRCRLNSQDGLRHCLTDTMSYGSGSSGGLTRAVRLSAFALSGCIQTCLRHNTVSYNDGNMSWEQCITGCFQGCSYGGGLELYQSPSGAFRKVNRIVKSDPFFHSESALIHNELLGKKCS